MGTKKTSKVYKTIETEILDKETGEIVSNKSETEKIIFEKEPPFVKLYIDDIVLLNRLPEGVSGVLYDIVSNMGYNNLYIAHQTLKEISCKRLKLSLNTSPSVRIVSVRSRIFMSTAVP